MQWLAARCRLPVRTARNGDTPAAGTVLVAASNDHLELAPDLGLRYTATPMDYPYRPSVDVLFMSAATVWPRPGVAVLLTGMGSDGAEGMSRLRARGGIRSPRTSRRAWCTGCPRLQPRSGPPWKCSRYHKSARPWPHESTRVAHEPGLAPFLAQRSGIK